MTTAMIPAVLEEELLQQQPPWCCCGQKPVPMTHEHQWLSVRWLSVTV